MLVADLPVMITADLTCVLAGTGLYAACLVVVPVAAELSSKLENL